MIRVLLADDENLIRTALASLLAIQDDLQVVAQAGSGDEALAMARRHRPDVAVLDLQMPGLDGIAVAEQLVTELPACGSLILTSYGPPGHLKRALATGVRPAPAAGSDRPPDRIPRPYRIAVPVMIGEGQDRSEQTTRPSLAGRPVALASSGEALELPCVHAGHPVPAVLGRWADPRVAENMGVTQGVHVRPILVDPCVYLISSADGPVAGDDDIDVARHALEQPQRGEVVLDRVGGVVQVEHRNQDIRKHVAGDENPAFLNQQRRMARGMRLMLDNPDLRAIPGNPRSFGGQAGDEAEQVQRYLPGDVRRYPLGDAGLPTRVLQPISGSGRAAGRAVTGRRAEPGVPEQVIPMRMRREACHNGLAQLAKVVREGGHFAAVHPGVDEQHASPAVHDNGVALAELALVDQHTLRDLPQHGIPSRSRAWAAPGEPAADRPVVTGRYRTLTVEAGSPSPTR